MTPRLGLLLAALLGGCTVGPDYQRPHAPLPAEFAETAGWTALDPRDAPPPAGEWWQA